MLLLHVDARGWLENGGKKISPLNFWTTSRSRLAKATWMARVSECVGEDVPAATGSRPGVKELIIPDGSRLVWPYPSFVWTSLMRTATTMTTNGEAFSRDTLAIFLLVDDAPGPGSQPGRTHSMNTDLGWADFKDCEAEFGEVIFFPCLRTHA